MSGSRQNSWSSGVYDENPFGDDSGHNTSNVPLNGGGIGSSPPWLQDGNNNSNSNSNNNSSSSSQATSFMAPLFSSFLSSGSSASGGGGAEPDPEGETQATSAEKAVPRYILYTRIINLVLSILMILVSFLSLLTTQTATTGVLSIYVIIFSCLLCCFETHLKQVSKMIALNFGFMYSAKARSVFMVFIGTILFSFSLFGKIMGLCMLANAGLNSYILCKYPEYEEMARNDAQQDIKDFLAKNPAFAKNITDLGVKTGGDILKSNPELAQKGASALLSSATSSKSSGGDGRGSYANV